jgi:DNA-binding transcriptional regulator YiaG
MSFRSKRKYKSDALASIHEMISDLYEIGLIDQQAMNVFDASCLVKLSNKRQQLNPVRRGLLGKRKCLCKLDLG